MPARRRSGLPLGSSAPSPASVVSPIVPPIFSPIFTAITAPVITPRRLPLGLLLPPPFHHFQAPAQ